MNWLCWIPILSALVGVCGNPGPLAVGYAEGEYVLLAPIETARIEKIMVRRGDHVGIRQIVARLETEDAVHAVAEARAAEEQAEAQLRNLEEGQRPEEIAVIEASLDSAAAQHREAERRLERQRDLQKRGFASQAELDAAQTAVERTQARMAELQANLNVARLPARKAEIVAARNRFQQTQAARESAEWRLSQRMIRAPAPGQVTDIILREGEVAGATAPVLKILPDDGIKVKIYIPQKAFSSIEQGTQLILRCDGCNADFDARVSYVATEPEFTPPVIYSINNRQKLVYLVEARPENRELSLKPGQIVDVYLRNRDGDGQ